MSPASDEFMAVWKQKSDRARELRKREREEEGKKGDTGGGGEEGDEAPKKMVREGEPVLIQLFQANQSIWFL